MTAKRAGGPSSPSWVPSRLGAVVDRENEKHHAARLARFAAMSQATARAIARIYPDLRVFELALVHGFKPWDTPEEIGEAVVAAFEKHVEPLDVGSRRPFLEPEYTAADLRADVVAAFALIVRQYRRE